MRRWLMVGVSLLFALSAACGGGGEDEVDTPGTSASSTTTTTAPEVGGYGLPVVDSSTTSTEGSAGTSATTARPRARGTSATQPPATTGGTSPPQTTSPPPPATTTTAASNAPTATITIQNFTFQPPFLRVAPGTRVTATNKDAAAHTWTASNGAWDSGNLEQNQSYTHIFDTAGTFTYRCQYHGSMTGTVQVG